MLVEWTPASPTTLAEAGWHLALFVGRHGEPWEMCDGTTVDLQAVVRCVADGVREIDSLRVRVRAEPQDIARAKAAGLTGDKVRAWAKANGDFAISPGWSGEIDGRFASTVRWWASEVGRPDLHVLDEMVSMEVFSDG